MATELAPSSGHDTVADIVAVPSVAEQPLPFLLPVWQRTWRVPNTLPPAAGDATFCPSILNGGTCASHMTANLVGGCAAMVIHAGRRTACSHLLCAGPRCPLVHVAPPSSHSYHFTVWAYPDELGPNLQKRVQAEKLTPHDNGCYRIFGMPHDLVHCFSFASSGKCSATKVCGDGCVAVWLWLWRIA